MSAADMPAARAASASDQRQRISKKNYRKAERNRGQTFYVVSEEQELLHRHFSISADLLVALGFSLRARRGVIVASHKLFDERKRKL